jgi:hypothetical protein
MLTLAVVAILTLAGCGSSGSSGTSAVSTPGLSAGQIEGFGSVIVNGVEFETESAEIEIEGLETASQNDLREGMLVEVEGTFNADDSTGNATRVRFEDTLEGPITAMAPSDTGLVKTLTVLGQTVIVESGVTLFDNTPPLTFADLDAGLVIEVSGHTMADGSIRATFIELKAATLADFEAAGGLFEIKGMVSNLDSALNTFNIGALLIDFTGVIPRDGVLADGVMVEVKGSSLNGNTLLADDIEVRRAGLGRDDLARVELEGFVANLNLDGDTFTLNGQMVDFSGALFRGGIEDDLADGMKVEARGQMVNGLLVATRVTFKETVRIEDNAAGAMVGNSLILEGLGLTVLTDSAITEIRLEDGFQLGDGVKLRGRLNANGDIIAIRLEEVSPRDRVELQGPVSDIADPVVTIIGIDVDTSTIREDDPSGSDFEIEDQPVTKAAFFAAMAASPNPIVKARADLPAPLVWDHIELEIEDD